MAGKSVSGECPRVARVRSEPTDDTLPYKTLAEVGEQLADQGVAIERVFE